MSPGKGRIATMWCTIGFRNVELSGGLGVYAEEQGVMRPYFMDLDLAYDASEAAASDQLDHALDYASIAAELKALAQSRHFGLLEHLARTLLDRLFEGWPRLGEARLHIRKPGALPGGGDSYVRVVARRKGQGWESKLEI